jgi:hypothetical protein
LSPADNNPATDNTLPGVVLLVAAAVSVALIASANSWYRQRSLIQQAGQWVPVEGRIESVALEAVRESGKIILLTFAFSYQGSREVLFPQGKDFHNYSPNDSPSEIPATPPTSLTCPAHQRKICP